MDKEKAIQGIFVITALSLGFIIISLGFRGGLGEPIIYSSIDAQVYYDEHDGVIRILFDNTGVYTIKTDSPSWIDYPETVITIMEEETPTGIRISEVHIDKDVVIGYNLTIGKPLDELIESHYIMFKDMS